MSEFIVTDQDGKEFVVNAPDGATQDQALEYAKSQFGSTQGGAATGNPNIQSAAPKAIKADTGNSLEAIGGAGAIGGVLGTFGSEIMSGLAKATSAFPQTNRLTPYLETAAAGLRNAGRLQGGISGAISGIAGETAGQVAELYGAGPTSAELARIAGGAVGPELKNLAAWGVKKAAGASGVTDIIDAARKYAGKDIKLTDAQEKFLESEIAAIRGGVKSDDSLERVGSIMGAEGNRLMSMADQKTIAAMRQAASVGNAGGNPAATIDDIGQGLRSVITKRNEAALSARKSQYSQNEQARDAIVQRQESAGQFVNKLPEYDSLVAAVQKELDNSIAMNRSPAVQANYRKILNGLTNPEKFPADEKLVLSGQNLDLVKQPQQPKPISFQALDDLRRQLGEAFRGKPPEGFEAISANTAKELYGKISQIQKKYAGAPQAALLDDYANSTQGLETFSSRLGKKATALDQYRDDAFATDAATLPGTYFKTRTSVQALKELTGNATLVNNAALDYADKVLAGKSASQVREWMGKNAGWLGEVGPTRKLIDNYAGRLEAAERATASAKDVATAVAKDASILMQGKLPVQKAVDLIKSGDPQVWSKVTPLIAQSPQAKEQMVKAVRQVVSDQATAKGAADTFQRNIRPFLESGNIASKAELDFITKRLENIRDMKVPEPEKLGIIKRMLLQGAAGWAASAEARKKPSDFSTLMIPNEYAK